MSTNPTPGAGESAPSPPDFDPVPVRYRRDGWTPERQVAFIRAIAECGCVVEACRRVGLSSEGAYQLARRPDAQSFRIAWDLAMDQAVRRAGDGAVARSINGVDIPHFYKGELVGTHKRYDERLTMFVLRTRDPLRFGRHLEQGVPIGSREDKALQLADVVAWAKCDAEKDSAGRPRTVYAGLGAATDDGEDGTGAEEAAAVRHRPSPRVYDTAPRPEWLLDEEDEDEEGGEPLDGEWDEEDLEVAAASLEQVFEEQLAALRAGEPVPDTMTALTARLDAARAARGRPPLPPDVSRSSSTSAAAAAELPEPRSGVCGNERELE